MSDCCGFCGCAGQLESYLEANPEDSFSRDEAHMLFDIRVAEKQMMWVFDDKVCGYLMIKYVGI